MRRLLVRLLILGICLIGSQLLLRDTRASAADRLSEELIEACWMGDLPRVKTALARGAQINRELRETGSFRLYPPTPLIAAALKGDVSVVKYLLEQGADPNRPSSSGETPLCGAAFNANLEAFRLLLRHGARKDCGGGEGRSIQDEVYRHRKGSVEGLRDAPGYKVKTLRAELKRYDAIIRLLQTPSHR